ncbi:hypothetical protein TNCV_514631 [Trichonephila clavipes]|nr:hypothetical protein TNCV_514631 [Trichonephila clavipes]
MTGVVESRARILMPLKLHHAEAQSPPIDVVGKFEEVVPAQFAVTESESDLEDALEPRIIHTAVATGTCHHVEWCDEILLQQWFEVQQFFFSQTQKCARMTLVFFSKEY